MKTEKLGGGRKIQAKGVEVTIEEEIEVEFEGKKLSYAEYRKYSGENMRQRVHSSSELKDIWINSEKKKQFIKDLEDKKVNIELIKSIDNLEDNDSFDVIAHLAFNAPLLTREDRTKNFVRENAKSIREQGEGIRVAIHEILDKYQYSGEENLSADIFMLPDMNAQKKTIQKEYSNGLTGFMSFIKDKIYSEVTVTK